MTELPKAIAKSLKIAVIMVFTVAILWTSLPIEASPGQANSSGIGTLDFSSLTLQCEALSLQPLSQALKPIGVLVSWATAYGK